MHGFRFAFSQKTVLFWEGSRNPKIRFAYFINIDGYRFLVFNVLNGESCYWYWRKCTAFEPTFGSLSSCLAFKLTLCSL